MNLSAAVALLLMVGLVGANLPFLSERLLFVGPRGTPKGFAWRLVELLLMWAVTLTIGFALESRIGQRQPQGWEFYAALGFVFLTFAFPGFIWRYLRHGR